MIKEQQYWIELESERVANFAELIIDYIERVLVNSKNASDAVIIYSTFGEINRKLSELSETFKKVNFMKA
jgi:hypothetical protein